jgi:MarR family 2-MHQ and catechol resistance regulon transcriptional repressor
MEQFGVSLNTETSRNKSIYLVIGLFQKINSQLEKSLKGFNLSLAKFNVLMIVKHQGGKDGLSQVEIGKKLLVTPANITKMVDRLDKDSLLTRVSHVKDRRSNVIKITDKGSILLDEVWIKYQEQVNKLTQGLSEKELFNLNKILEQWYKDLI